MVFGRLANDIIIGNVTNKMKNIKKLPSLYCINPKIMAHKALTAILAEKNQSVRYL